MRKLLLTIIIASLIMTMYSQETEQTEAIFSHKNSVQVELFGHGVFYSLNYERVLLNGHRFKTTGQVGVSYYPPQTGIIDIWVPVVVNELLTFDKHHIELGLGYVFINERVPTIETGIYTREWGGFIAGRLGYRYQKPDGRLIIRAGFTPFFEYQGGMDIHPSGGLAIGYNF